MVSESESDSPDLTNSTIELLPLQVVEVAASATPIPVEQENGTNAAVDEEQPGPSCLAAGRAELDGVQIFSKFEKHGLNCVLKPLKQELRNIQHGRVVTRLYKYQIEAVIKVKDHFDRLEELEGTFKPALIIAPPGSGKSGMVTLIPYVLESKKVLVLTPAKVITDQLAGDFGLPHPDTGIKTPFLKKCGLYLEDRHLNKLLETVNVIATQKDIDYMTASNLVIVNAQKFGGRAAHSLSVNHNTPERISRVQRQLQEFDTIIVDEAHHYPASTWVNVVHVFAGKKVIFLTATPFRGEVHMTNALHLDVEIVYEILSRELEGKTIRRTEFIERSALNEELGDAEFMEQLSEDIQELLQKHRGQENRTPLHQAMILVTTKAEAEEVASALGEHATFVYSGKEGQKNLEAFTKGQKQIVVVCGMLREGYDNPNVSLVVILRKCQSRVLFEQFCGRCSRINRNLTGKEPDRTVGTVLSYRHFRQSDMWAKMSKNAEEDPVDEGDGDGIGINSNTLYI